MQVSGSRLSVSFPVPAGADASGVDARVTVSTALPFASGKQLPSVYDETFPLTAPPFQSWRLDAGPWVVLWTLFLAAGLLRRAGG